MNVRVPRLSLRRIDQFAAAHTVQAALKSS
ncbi:type II toxin-antitoxin system HicB family antitoxin [Erwinia amylovora]|nr:type II toxin-antitoxin system HicB family antitoxin [Erwinia amylovora]MBZ2397003.1 type II toxin-antitoxin system HicB family antitoxin [Erwinia amylovora]MBZ2400288.1 type II toxin-antitoxin system HicB family antitoxin [Erwinia amylovora]MBZ2403216.1 type II toxin-antitoxin system HicB family antitoxin [Erwinia amylovora]MCK8157167.1 type II toxin-antitoxin system HicB family antitoxin [Erwinia amylovora]